MDPATAVLSGIGNAVNTTVTFAKFVYEIKNTPTDVKTCLDLVSRVDEDIQYAISLRQKHLKYLSSTPEELKRINRIIASANQSILDVGRLLEGCRREAHGGQVPMIGRMKWVMGDSTAFARRTANLQQQHAAINVEIAFLRQLEALQPVKDFLTSNTTFENPELLSMGRRRSSSKLSTKYSEMNLIDLNPPPEYSPPVPAHSPPGSSNDNIAPGSNEFSDPFEVDVPAKDPSTHIQSQPCAESNHEETRVEDVEDEDPEVAFYRELREQEEERRRRLAARAGNG